MSRQKGGWGNEGLKYQSSFVNCHLIMAGPTGLEPAPSGVTGRRYNQLNYGPIAVAMELKGYQAIES